MMSRAVFHSCGIALGAMLAISSPVVAQPAHLVVGVVLDSVMGGPLSGALIDLRSLTFQRATQSNQRGEFRLGDVPVGDYRLTVRRIGFAAHTSAFRLLNADTSHVVSLHAIARELDTVRAVAYGMGIYGVIGTSQGVRPLADAKVQVMGLNRAAVTDSLGRFFIDIARPGTYLVRVAHTGYAHQLLPVDVSPDRAAESSTLLDTLLRRELGGTEALWHSFDQRLMWRGSRSAVVTSAELEELEGMALTDALNKSSSAFRRGLRIGTNTCVFIDGRPRPGWPVDAFRIENVDAVELYGPGADATNTLYLAWPSRFPCSVPQGGPFGGAGLPAGTAAYAVIWLKP